MGNDNDEIDNPDQQDEISVRSRSRTKRPRRFKVVLHNDDYTTREFVIDVLQTVFHKANVEATRIMLTVHHKGKGVCGVYSRDIAATKVAQVVEAARDHGFPLHCTMEGE
jgi:ATP-dependent Clp protease adaptor protein ClpS